MHLFLHLQIPYELVLCQDLVQVKMSFPHLNLPSAIRLSGFYDTVLHNHLETYRHNGYEYVLYCRMLPDIRRPIGTHDHNRGF